MLCLQPITCCGGLVSLYSTSTRRGSMAQAYHQQSVHALGAQNEFTWDRAGYPLSNLLVQRLNLFNWPSFKMSREWVAYNLLQVCSR